jgi:hypothetical protein
MVISETLGGMPTTNTRANHLHGASHSPLCFNIARPQFQYAQINLFGELSQMPAPYPPGHTKILNRLIWLFTFLSIFMVTLYLVSPSHRLLLGTNPRILKIITLGCLFALISALVFYVGMEVREILHESRPSRGENHQGADAIGEMRDNIKALQKHEKNVEKAQQQYDSIAQKLDEQVAAAAKAENELKGRLAEAGGAKIKNWLRLGSEGQTNQTSQTSQTSQNDPIYEMDRTGEPGQLDQGALENLQGISGLQTTVEKAKEEAPRLLKKLESLDQNLQKLGPKSEALLKTKRDLEDRYGVIYQDLLITEINNTLRSRFDTTKILARIRRALFFLTVVSFICLYYWFDNLTVLTIFSITKITFLIGIITIFWDSDLLKGLIWVVFPGFLVVYLQMAVDLAVNPVTSEYHLYFVITHVPLLFLVAYHAVLLVQNHVPNWRIMPFCILLIAGTIVALQFHISEYFFGLYPYIFENLMNLVVLGGAFSTFLFLSLEIHREGDLEKVKSESLGPNKNSVPEATLSPVNDDPQKSNPTYILVNQALESDGEEATSAELNLQEGQAQEASSLEAKPLKTQPLEAQPLKTQPEDSILQSAVVSKSAAILKVKNLYNKFVAMFIGFIIGLFFFKLVAYFRIFQPFTLYFKDIHVHHLFVGIGLMLAVIPVVIMIQKRQYQKGFFSLYLLLGLGLGLAVDDIIIHWITQEYPFVLYRAEDAALVGNEPSSLSGEFIKIGIVFLLYMILSGVLYFALRQSRQQKKPGDKRNASILFRIRERILDLKLRRYQRIGVKLIQKIADQRKLLDRIIQESEIAEQYLIDHENLHYKTWSKLLKLIKNNERIGKKKLVGLLKMEMEVAKIQLAVKKMIETAEKMVHRLRLKQGE